jgi:glucose/mannose-6-phosphate isomerase
MKSILDDPKTYGRFDTLDVYDSIQTIGQQFESAWHDAQFVSLNFDITQVKNIVYVGMGGSGLAAHVISSLSPLLIKVPFEIVANYRLPQYVDKNTLVTLASYSGNTEEVLSCAQDAIKRHSLSIVITAGGKLKELALTEHLPLILLDESLNRTHTPRYGLGLLLGAAMGVTVRLNSEAFRFVDPKEIVRTIDRSFGLLNKDISTVGNPAKSFAQKNTDRTVIVISANHLAGVGKIMANFINETSKTFSTTFNIPDLNHHLLEGLTFPVALKDHTRFVLLNSSLYPDIIQKRFQITRDILIKQGYQLTEIKPESADIVLQVFESLVFSLMISYYLCIANKQDPSGNPWVDYIKKQLS